jgi:hypothetical protein
MRKFLVAGVSAALLACLTVLPASAHPYHEARRPHEGFRHHEPAPYHREIARPASFLPGLPVVLPNITINPTIIVNSGNGVGNTIVVQH